MKPVPSPGADILKPSCFTRNLYFNVKWQKSSKRISITCLHLGWVSTKHENVPRHIVPERTIIPFLWSLVISPWFLADPWQIPDLGQVPQLKTILKCVLRTKYFNSKEVAILQVPVPGMLKVPIHSSQAAISTCWTHQSQRDAAMTFLRGCGTTAGAL